MSEGEHEVIREGLIEVIVRTFRQNDVHTDHPNLQRLLAQLIVDDITKARYAVISRDRLNRLYGSLEEVSSAVGLLKSILGKVPRPDGSSPS